MLSLAKQYGSELGFAGENPKDAGVNQHRAVGEGMSIEIRVFHQVELEGKPASCGSVTSLYFTPRIEMSPLALSFWVISE
jgi:hypothetical protein